MFFLSSNSVTKTFYFIYSTFEEENSAQQKITSLLVVFAVEAFKYV